MSIATFVFRKYLLQNIVITLHLAAEDEGCLIDTLSRQRSDRELVSRAGRAKGASCVCIQISNLNTPLSNFRNIIYDTALKNIPRGKH